MVACDKKKTALVCFWSEKYHTRAFLGLGKALDLRSRAFPGQEKHSCDIFTSKTLVQFSYYVTFSN
jgi:hypothetical protein